MHLKDEEEKVSRLLHSELEALKVQYSDLQRSLIDDETEKENLRQQIFHLRSELKKKDDALTTIASIPQNSKEMTNLSEKIKMLEDLLKSKEMSLETSASSLLEKESELQSKVDELKDKVEELNQRIMVVADTSFTSTNDRSEEVRSTIEHLNDTSCISEENRVVVSSSKSHDLSEKEEEIHTMDTNGDGSFSDVLTELSSLKERDKSMQTELKELQERYSEMSLKFAEVEERYPLQISNAWTGTKLIINEDVLEIIDFRKSLPADNTYATQNQLLPSSSQSFSAQSSAAGSQMSPEGRFIQGHRVLKQIDIIRLNKDEIVITVVTTSHLRPLAEDGNFFCMYRIDVQVHDGDDNAKFVFCDNTCIELLGITAGELQKNMLEAGEDDRLDHPLLLDEMMGQTFAFRVKWQKEWRQGPVLEIKDDKLLAGKIQQQLMESINTVSLSLDDEDRWGWVLEKGEEFTIKSTYRIISNLIVHELAASPWHAPIFTSVWKCPTPSKVSGFVWQLLHGRVPTQNNLITRRVLAVEEDVSCALCGEEKETELHLFLYCEIAVQKGTQKLGMV
ncbi:hypothetical protein QL285_079190 [Trifolium repens]|nr:hypothetical protein QL285_079190 [Trifolium repens]